MLFYTPSFAIIHWTLQKHLSDTKADLNKSLQTLQARCNYLAQFYGQPLDCKGQPQSCASNYRAEGTPTEQAVLVVNRGYTEGKLPFFAPIGLLWVFIPEGLCGVVKLAGRCALCIMSIMLTLHSDHKAGCVQRAMIRLSTFSTCTRKRLPNRVTSLYDGEQNLFAQTCL